MQIPNKDISRGLRLRLRLADVFKYFRSSTKYKYIQSVFAGLGVEVGVAPCNSEIRNLTSCRKLFYLSCSLPREAFGFELPRSQYGHLIAGL